MCLAGYRRGNYKHAWAQMLNCMGASGVETVPLDKLAKAMAKGNKAAIYFTEFCDDLASRKGIAVSRLAEIQLAAGARLSLPIYEAHRSRFCTRPQCWSSQL